MDIVYILTNTEMPDLIKIGPTKDLGQRLKAFPGIRGGLSLSNVSMRVRCQMAGPSRRKYILLSATIAPIRDESFFA